VWTKHSVSSVTLCLMFLASGTLLHSARAEEPYLPFLKALRDAGYGEAAVTYVEQLQQRTDIPVQLREVLDLELAQSLLTAADETDHRDIAEQRLAAAKTALDKFLKEHANHASAPAAFASLADLEIERGQGLLRQARVQKDNAAKGPIWLEARAAFESARPKYAQTVERYGQRLARLVAERQGTNKRMTKREEEQLVEAEMEWLEMRGKAALLDYYVAQTYSDPNDKARKDALTRAGKALDEIYQRERAKTEGLTSTGLYAHMWHGKVLDELGDLVTAEDIYDEVLANAPTGGDTRTSVMPLIPLFAQVEYFRLLILIKKKAYEDFISEAREWLDTHKRSEKTNGYQGISLELAKALGGRAETAKPDDARKLKREAMAILAQMVDVPSEFQQDALVLRRLMSDTKTPIANYEEAVALGQAAVESNQLTDAIDYYTQAIELSKKEQKLDPEEVIKLRYRLANILWAAGKLDQATQAAEAIILENAKSPTAPAAATLAINSAKSAYFAENKADAKAEALARLVKLSDYTVQNWPDRAEADDARIALGQASMVRGELDAALKAFETVKPESDRYSQALHQAGQVNWQLYLKEKGKPPTQRDANKMAELRGKAEQQLVQTREAQRKALKADEPPPQTLLDTELLLAEVSLEGNKAEEAVKLLEPMIEASRASSAGALDRTKLRMFLAAVRAYVAMKSFDKAAAVAAVLIESGEDSPVVNLVLVDFAKMLGTEYKRIQAQFVATQAGDDPQAKAQAAATVREVQTLFTKSIDQLSARKHHSVANTIYLGETCADIGLTAKAREQFEAILKKAAEEKGSVQPQAEIRIRAKLIGLLRNEKKFAEALPEVEKLIAATGGRALEPLVEKGYILQAQAESTPFDPKLYEAAVSHWTSLRLRMQNMNPKPPEYYQLIYHTAACVMIQAEQAKDKTKALQVIQILNSVLQLNRAALAPDMVTKYDALVARARKLQAGQPLPTGLR
jgi:tetratricopeptide (TPR) repeat protein